MNLSDEIAAANDVFFDTDEFGETVAYWPLGVESNAFNVVAVVDWTNEEGSNQVRGDGRSDLNDKKGRFIRSSAIVELPTTRVDSSGDTVYIRVNESGKDRIVVTENGKSVKLNVKRVIGHDAHTQSVLCIRPREIQGAPYGRVG